MKTMRISLLIIFLTLTIAGCSKSTPTVVPTATQIQNTVVPTATSLPMAVMVNGEGILLSDYEAEINRLQMALNETGQQMTSEQQKERITGNFIDELLLSQAAVKNGYSVSDEELQKRIDSLVGDIGGQDPFNAWLAKYGYTEETFRDSLRRSLLVTWERDQIINDVPTTADQVHARQLIFQDEAQAQDALSQIRSGVDFSTLAEAQDPTLGGDLGWFPQGTLTQPAVEAAVFALQPGETSDVIKSSIGYHIINLIERDPQHPLSIEARRKLQEAALDEWLKSARDASSIEILIP